MSLFDELKRRKVFRVAAIYTASAFAMLQAADLLVEALGMPGGVLTGAAIVSIIGFPVALVLAWIFDIGPKRPDSDETTGGAEIALPPPHDRARRRPASRGRRGRLVPQAHPHVMLTRAC